MDNIIPFPQKPTNSHSEGSEEFPKKVLSKDARKNSEKISQNKACMTQDPDGSWHVRGDALTDQERAVIIKNMED